MKQIPNLKKIYWTLRIEADKNYNAEILRNAWKYVALQLESSLY